MCLRSFQTHPHVELNKMKIIALVLISAFAVTSLEVNSDFVKCETCREVFKKTQDFLLRPNIWTVPIELAIDYCQRFDGYTKDVCAGGVGEMVTIVTSSLAKHYFDPEWACSTLEFCDSPIYVRENFTEWQANVLKSKPVTPAPASTSETPTLRFGHVSDIHVDIYYQEGTNNNCGLPVCCRSWNGPGESGVWGDYNCDLPIKTFEVGLQQLAEQNLDFVLVTGDIPPHDVWNQSYAYILEYQQVVSGMFEKYFPDTPVYTMYGNHGAFPVNVLDMNNATWLNQPFSELWGSWLTEEAKLSMASKGFYSLVHPDTNLKIVTVNTQACNNDNFFLLANVTDPAGHIGWLWNELDQAEKANQIVYLFGHIPMSSGDCLDTWAAHVNTLTSRYAHLIAGQFYGHTHKDHWSIYRDLQTQAPNNIEWVAPSVTTYQQKNPSFRVYEADPVNFQVVDIHQFRMDMNKSNLTPAQTPVFELAYSYKSFWSLPDLTPASMFALSNQILVNETLAVDWQNNYETGYGPISSCDLGCRQNIACNLLWGTSAEQNVCLNSKNGLIQEVYLMLFGPWTYKVVK